MKRFGMIYLSVFVAIWAQMAINPLIAPLSRRLDLADWQAGAMLSTAAVMLVLTAGRWARTSQRRGRKPVLVAALLIAAFGAAGFAAVAYAGFEGALRGAPLVVSLVLARGLVFGLGLAAVLPTAQAYIADAMDSETERVSGMSGIGAAQGMAMMAGSAIGGLLGGLGLMVPLTAIPIVLVAGAVFLHLRLPEQPAHELIAEPQRVRPTDPRVWPFLSVGFGAFTALGFIQVLVGFLVIDRSDLADESAATVTGLMLLCAGVGMLVAQVIVVPRSGWGIATLLPVGALIALVGFAVMLPALPVAVLALGCFVVALGLGILMPAYSAGPSLQLSREEQGGLAGLIWATNAMTFIAAPLLGTVLYGLAPPAPLIASLVVMAGVVVFALTHPTLRRAGQIGSRVPEGAQPEV